MGTTHTRKAARGVRQQVEAVTDPGDMLDMWKRQLDAAMRVTEVVIECSERLREVQLEAATEAHADALATQKALAGANSPQELMRIQTEWLAASQRKSMQYWKTLYEAAADTNTQVVKRLSEATPTRHS